MSSTSRIPRYDEWRATRYFSGLEGLRAVAALLVVFHHARTHRLWGALEGWNGVTLFFVLSGFLITTLALREEDEHGALRWRAFVIRRGFRILPIYFASLALYAVVMFSVGLGGSHRSVFTHALPWYLSPFPEVPFFTKTHIVFSLAWSLGIEEKFYLLWPLLAFVVGLDLCSHHDDARHGAEGHAADDALGRVAAARSLGEMTYPDDGAAE